MLWKMPSLINQRKIKSSSKEYDKDALEVIGTSV